MAASDLKDTLNLPLTRFPMRASLSKREPERLAAWKAAGLYGRLREARKGKVRWILHDGPPYANGHIHLGTALNKILKDVVVRFRALEGHDVPYVPGWDCHGMPIEHRVVREMGEDAAGADPMEIRVACRDYAARFASVQSEEFQRLGCLGDWEHPYLSMSHEYEATIVRAVRELAEKGYIYRGLRPIHWCASCRTALADAEVEYASHRSPAVTVRFPLEEGWAEGRPELPEGMPAHVLIWTTTPWTLPANLAVAVHPDYAYAWYRVGEEVWLLAERLAPAVLEAAGVVGEKLRTEEGRHLVGLSYTSPLNGRSCPFLLAGHVTLEQGTGCVHTAPGHGHEDFELGRSAGLEILNPVGPDGVFTEEAGEWRGRHVFEANALIAERLRETGLLLHDEEMEHSYPHCWRCHQPVLFRATEQWFLEVDNDSLRDRCIEALDSVLWVPRWGYERIRNMLVLRPDWCLSRQRAWGVPIPAFRCRGCGGSILLPEWIRRVEEIVGREGADAWFTHTERDLLPEDAACPECGSRSLDKETDILDVWFDSSCSHLAVLEKREDLAWPSQLYLEAGDQHRGWFQVSLINAMALRGGAPFQGVFTHGLILDENAKKMSKSLGNVISPEEILDRYGADILRLAFLSVDYTADILFSRERTLEPAAESYRKVRNTCRFLLGNLHDFHPGDDEVPERELLPLDRHALGRLNRFARECIEEYRAYGFHRGVRRLVNYCTVELSSFYLDVLKDRLYCEAPGGRARRSAQTVLYRQLGWLVRLLAPICPFTAEEVWGHAVRGPGEPDFVQISVFPTAGPDEDDLEARDLWDRLLGVRNAVLAGLEEARAAKTIGNSLEALVELRAGGDLRRLLEAERDRLPELFIVSQVLLGPEPSGAEEGPEVEVRRAEGTRCDRCWKVLPDVEVEAGSARLCGRCRSVLQDIGR